MEAVVAMDFNALSRRELQALSKLNGIRANMTNLAMAEALQSLLSVDGIDRLGTTLCLPTPGKSAMKSVMKAEAAVGEDQQQHGSPLPRGRRVSVKSPEAIRMDLEDGEKEVKREFIKDIVRTPGVALRSTGRRLRATPAPIPTPAAGTLRRSQRSTARKAAPPVEVEVSNTKRSTRRTKVMLDLDQEDDVPVAPEEVKVQEVEPKVVACDEKCDEPEEEVTAQGSSKVEDGVVSDEKCDGPQEEEVTGHLKEGNCEVEEPKQDEEVIFCAAPNGSADISFVDSKVEEIMVVIEKATVPHEEETAIEEKQELLSFEESAPLAAMEDSPILGVLSKVEALEQTMKDASIQDSYSSCNWSSVLEITDEIHRANQHNKEAAAVEVPKEDAFNSTREAADAPNKVLPAALTDNETEEGEGLNEDSENSNNEIPQTDLTEDDGTEEYDTDGDRSEEADIDEAFLTVDVGHVATGKVNSTSEADEEGDESYEGSDSSEDSSEEEEEVAKEINDDGESDSTRDEDDFTADLSPEFENARNFSDAEPVTDSSPAAASAVKTVVKSQEDYSAITEEIEVSSEGDQVSQQAAVTDKKIDTVVKSLEEFTISEELTEGKKESHVVGAKEKKSPSLTKLKSTLKQKLIANKVMDGKSLEEFTISEELTEGKKESHVVGAKEKKSPSLTKLKSTLKQKLIANKEKERLALAKLDQNAGVDC